MNGQCLAGDSCQFLHDTSLLMNQLNMNESALSSSPSNQGPEQNELGFPALANTTPRSTHAQLSSGNGYFSGPGSLAQQRAKSGLGAGSRQNSRPSSRHQNRPETPSSLSMDDPEAFPTLGSLSAKRPAKHHGHRSRHGHGSGEKEVPSSLADVVKMSPSPAPAQLRKNEPTRKIRTSGGSDTAAARRIPEPQHIPWLETGSRANQQYLKYRQEAIKHGSIRNKFLQR